MDVLERVALVLLNDDRQAAGLPTVPSRDNIPDSEGYVRNARAVVAAVLDEVAAHLSAVQYDPAPYTTMKVRLSAMRAEMEV